LAPEALCARIPHAGSMCLIDEVVSWDEDSIQCRTRSHLGGENPLRRAGRLACVHLIEYAGQAAALHGSLTAAAQAWVRPAVLAAVKDVRLYVDDLGAIGEPLLIHARRILRAGLHTIYRFQVDGGGRCLGSGQMSVIATGEVPK
jgi:predicted hotdog family 3-hydroxylacyl-ACP dehydratase